MPESERGAVDLGGGTWVSVDGHWWSDGEKWRPVSPPSTMRRKLLGVLLDIVGIGCLLIIWPWYSYMSGLTVANAGGAAVDTAGPMFFLGLVILVGGAIGLFVASLVVSGSFRTPTPPEVLEHVGQNPQSSSRKRGNYRELGSGRLVRRTGAYRQHRSPRRSQRHIDRRCTRETSYELP
jgi:hypothetical protein